MRVSLTYWNSLVHWLENVHSRHIFLLVIWINFTISAVIKFNFQLFNFKRHFAGPETQKWFHWRHRASSLTRPEKKKLTRRDPSEIKFKSRKSNNNALLLHLRLPFTAYPPRNNNKPAPAWVCIKCWKTMKKFRGQLLPRFTFFSFTFSGGA